MVLARSGNIFFCDDKKFNLDEPKCFLITWHDLWHVKQQSLNGSEQGEVCSFAF